MDFNKTLSPMEAYHTYLKSKDARKEKRLTIFASIFMILFIIIAIFTTFLYGKGMIPLAFIIVTDTIGIFVSLCAICLLVKDSDEQDLQDITYGTVVNKSMELRWDARKKRREVWQITVNIQNGVTLQTELFAYTPDTYKVGDIVYVAIYRDKSFIFLPQPDKSRIS